MKTYLFDTFSRYKRFSDKLDVQAILCNKSWWVFNDLGEKELYIFQINGNLIISISGRVSNAKWEYIPANKSIIVTGHGQSYMVHPAFVDNIILVFQVDGTNEYAFLIAEYNLDTFYPQSLTELKEYFISKELQYIEEQQEQERIRVLQIEQKKRQEYEDQLRKKQEQKERKYLYNNGKYIALSVTIYSTAIIIGILISCLLLKGEKGADITIIIFISIMMSVCFIQLFKELLINPIKTAFLKKYRKNTAKE